MNTFFGRLKTLLDTLTYSALKVEISKPKRTKTGDWPFLSTVIICLVFYTWE